MARCVVPAADEILDKSYPVLDKGFVRLVDYMGGDQRIVQAARVSYGEGTKTSREDAALIDYLLRNDHTSPFEQVVLTFHVKLPVFVARQWIRHRTARMNEVSGRYSVMKDEFYLPAAEDVCAQSDDNKQGRMDLPLPEPEASAVIGILKRGQADAYRDYEELLGRGLAREIARINLPLSLYTEWYWQIDLHNLFRFLRLRLDQHAQREIRVYAETMLAITEKVCPVACASFRAHSLGGASLSAPELEAAKNLIKGKESGLSGRAEERFRKKLGLD